MLRLDGKVAMITGAAAGMGREASVLFAREGAKVAVVDLRPDGGEETVNKVRELGGKALFVKTDVSKSSDVQRAVKVTVEKYGKLNILYNNAAIPSDWGPITDWTEENFDRVMAINAKGVWLGMKYAIPEISRAGGGSIINTSSTAALIAQRNSSIYALSKGGVISLTRVAAVECAPLGIRVNCIAPGPIATQMLKDAFRDNPEALRHIETETPLGRLGEPHEVAQVALFLASDESSWITGQTIIVDGGIAADSHLDII
jgi:NAD(P)-dependent dehydrogenase (short-subunit alcohol dehydrogenase family)